MEPSVAPAPATRRAVLLAAGLLAVAALAAYHNSFLAPFVLDDGDAITENLTIRHLWPLWGALSPTAGGATVSGRPVLNLSLAVNYAISGDEVWSYHALNLLIHILAGLTLFGIVRRTLADVGRHRRMPPVRSLAGFGDPALQSDATFIAFTVALLWTLHPLQTEAVTYVIQRTESLLGLFFLLTLYCFLRAVSSPRPWPWRVLTVLACLGGVSTKEVAANRAAAGIPV